MKKKIKVYARIVPFKELGIGMLIAEGVVSRIGQPGSSQVFGKSAYLEVFDPHTSYYGQTSFSVNMRRKFTIRHEVGTPEYREEIQRLIAERIDYIMHAESDVDLLRAYQKFAPEKSGRRSYDRPHTNQG